MPCGDWRVCHLRGRLRGAEHAGKYSQAQCRHDGVDARPPHARQHRRAVRDHADAAPRAPLDGRSRQPCPPPMQLGASAAHSASWEASRQLVNPLTTFRPRVVAVQMNGALTIWCWATNGVSLHPSLLPLQLQYCRIEPPFIYGFDVPVAKARSLTSGREGIRHPGWTSWAAMG